jgi:hypothetical protein
MVRLGAVVQLFVHLVALVIIDGKIPLQGLVNVPLPQRKSIFSL